jgi:hypothetical protein
MVAKLGFIVDGSGWDPANIIGSIYPQPTVANIGLLNADGITMLAGAAPTQIGSPIMGTGYQTLNGYNAGYDTGIADTPIKTMMALVKPVISGLAAVAGNRVISWREWHAASASGDTFVIDPVNLTVRAIGSTTTGVATSSLTLTSADLTKFMLLVADYSAAGVQLHMFREGLWSVHHWRHSPQGPFRHQRSVWVSGMTFQLRQAD